MFGRLLKPLFSDISVNYLNIQKIQNSVFGQPPEKYKINTKYMRNNMPSHVLRIFCNAYIFHLINTNDTTTHAPVCKFAPGDDGDEDLEDSPINSLTTLCYSRRGQDRETQPGGKLYTEDLIIPHIGRWGG